MSGRKHIKVKNFKPLSLGVKYSPYAIAVVYMDKNIPDKKYVHNVILKKEELVNKYSTSLEIYQTLVKREPLYLNPKVISKKQVLRFIELLIKRVAIDQEATAESSKEKTSAGPTPIKPTLGTQMMKKETEIGFPNEKSVYQKIGSAEECKSEDDFDDPIENLGNPGVNFEGMERVFVEDLNRELLMDENGNLFDFDGTLIGQADDEDID